MTVYSDRALVTRLGESHFTPGKYTIKLSGLPATLNDQSVRATGSGTATAKILDVQVETVYLDTISDQRTKSLQDKLKVLNSDMRKLNDRVAVLNQQKEFLSKITVASQENIASDLKVQRPTVEDWQNLLTFFDKNFTKLNAELQNIDIRKSELRLKIDALQNEIRKTGSFPSPREKEILVSIGVEREGKLDIEVSYLVQNAGWVPSYDIRVSSSDKKVELAYYGMVWQATGEDWTDIDLTLSTAQPSLGGMQPQLLPWYVNNVIPIRGRASAGEVLQDVTVEEAYRRHASLQSYAAIPKNGNTTAPMEMQTTEVVARATSASFEVPTKSSIPSDRTRHRVTIGLASLNGEFSYSAAPKLQPNAFFKATINNSTEYPLLAGPVAAFVDNGFVSTSTLPNVMPGEKFDVYLGVDNGIRVKRKLINKLTETSGIFSKSKRITYDVGIEVENLKQTSQSVSIQDNVPISQSDEITVDIESPKPEEASRDANGLITWKIDLKPGERRELNLKFSITFPSDMNISGLE